MTMTEASASGTVPPGLLGTLLYSISHDLKSPLLTLSLGNELLAGHVRADTEQVRIAIESLHHGILDMERMLEAVTRLSRAYHRQLSDTPVPLQQVMRGHVVITGADAERLLVAIDPRPVVDALGQLAGHGPLRLDLTIDSGAAVLVAPLRDAFPEPEAASSAPLDLLAGSLHTYAGTVIDTLAVLQLQLARQGGDVWLHGAESVIRLPLARSER